MLEDENYLIREIKAGLRDGEEVHLYVVGQWYPVQALSETAEEGFCAADLKGDDGMLLFEVRDLKAVRIKEPAGPVTVHLDQ